MSESFSPLIGPMQAVLTRHHWFEFAAVPDFDTQFDDWPLEIKLEFLNLVLILYNLHMISPRVFRLQYAGLVEKYDQDMLDLKEFATEPHLWDL